MGRERDACDGRERKSAAQTIAGHGGLVTGDGRRRGAGRAQPPFSEAFTTHPRTHLGEAGCGREPTDDSDGTWIKGPRAGLSSTTCWRRLEEEASEEEYEYEEEAPAAPDETETWRASPRAATLALAAASEAATRASVCAAAGGASEDDEGALWTWRRRGSSCDMVRLCRARASAIWVDRASELVREQRLCRAGQATGWPRVSRRQP